MVSAISVVSSSCHGNVPAAETSIKIPGKWNGRNYQEKMPEKKVSVQKEVVTKSKRG